MKRRFLRKESLAHNVRYDYSKNPYANLMLFKTDRELNDFVRKNSIKDFDTNINSYGDKVLYYNTSDDKAISEKFYRGNEYKYEREFVSEDDAYEFVEANNITKYAIQTEEDGYGVKLYYNRATEGFNRMRKHTLREDQFADARNLARQKRIDAKRKHDEHKANERITVTYEFTDEEVDEYDYIYWAGLDTEFNTDVKIDIENEGEDITVEDVSSESIEYTVPSDFGYEDFNELVVQRILDDTLDRFLDENEVEGDVEDLTGDVDEIINHLEMQFPNSYFKAYGDSISCTFNLGDLYREGTSTWYDIDSAIDDIVREWDEE